MAKLSNNELLGLLMNLLETTTPYGHENLLEKYLPANAFIDNIGNRWYQIGEDTESDTLFCCHLDTVGMKPEPTEPYYHKGSIFAMSSKSPCLGGDDRCGILSLVAMMYAGVPGWYLMHVGEEKGSHGAEFVAKNFDLSKFKRAIEFDRRGTTSVITKMMGHVQVCSSEFALALCKELGLGYVTDDTGVFTDVFEYNKLIPEITNLSVGYHNEHSNNEKICADWLIQKFIPALYNVKWELLPVVRNPLEERETFYHHRYSRTKEYTGSLTGDTSTSSSDKKGGNNVGNNANTSKSGSGSSSEKRSESSCRKTSSSRSDNRAWSDRSKSDISYLNKILSGEDEVEEEDGEDKKLNTAKNSISVFDRDNFAACHFCGDRDTPITDRWFDGRFWSLCPMCLEVFSLDQTFESNQKKYDAVVEIIEKPEISKESDGREAETAEIEIPLGLQPANQAKSEIDPTLDLDAEWGGLD